MGNVKLIILWMIVGIPLVFGVSMTLINVAKFFQ
jgi:hypothetical protein